MHLIQGRFFFRSARWRNTVEISFIISSDIPDENDVIFFENTIEKHMTTSIFIISRNIPRFLLKQKSLGKLCELCDPFIKVYGN